MAQGRRVERVAALIRKEVSELMINGIRDERVHQGMASITEVEVSGDLQHCKIFVSVFGEAQERDQVLEGLQAASGFLRGRTGATAADATRPRSGVPAGSGSGTRHLRSGTAESSRRRTAAAGRDSTRE